MNHQQKDIIIQLKRQAYNKGYIDGYQRGLEDRKSGAIDPNMFPPLLDQPIQVLGLSIRPFNSLDRGGYRTIGDIVVLRKEEIEKIRNLGSKGLHEIAWALWNQGIRDSEWNYWLYSD